MLKVPTDGGTQEFSRRLLRTIKGHDNETFLPIMSTSHPELPRLTQSQADRRLSNVFNYDPATLDEARELCAIKAWCHDACTTAADWHALPSHLREFVRMIHGVNKDFPRKLQRLLWQPSLIAGAPVSSQIAGRLRQSPWF